MLGQKQQQQQPQQAPKSPGIGKINLQNAANIGQNKGGQITSERNFGQNNNQYQQDYTPTLNKANSNIINGPKHLVDNRMDI